MISWLIGILAQFHAPYLIEPNHANQQRMAAVVATLRAADATVASIRSEGDKESPDEELSKLVMTPNPRSDLPPVSGRLFKDEARIVAEKMALEKMSKEMEETLPSLPDLSLLKLVGVIETESTRIGLISDGQQEWVVTAGSYLLGTLQVLRVEKVKAIVRFVARSDDMADEYEILMPEL